MLTTVSFDRLSAGRLPWVSLCVVLLWLGGAVHASMGGQVLGLVPDAVTPPDLLGHWIFQATGAQLAVGSLLLLVVGPVLEDAWGPVFFAVFLLLMALYTGGAYVAFPPDSARPLVGGAGLLAATLGACVARQWTDGIHYTAVWWQSRLRHAEFWIPAYALPAVWFAGEVILEVAAQGTGPTRGLAYSGQIAGVAMGALTGFALRHYDLEQRWLHRRPADAPDPVVENARLLLQGGSPDAALRVLQPAVAARPHDAELVGGLCEAAVAAREPEAARAPWIACVTRHLKSGEAAAAARLWKPWAEPLGFPTLDARLALPLAEALIAADGALAAARLLRDLLEEPARVSTGMALRIVEIARPVHAGVAIRAAGLALEGGDFPESKRARLEAIVRELETRRAERLDPQLEPSAPVGHDRSIEIALEEDDLSQPPPEIQAARRDAIDLPSDWPVEEQSAASDAGADAVPRPPAPDPAPAPPDMRDQLFGSSQEADLSDPEALMDTGASLAAAPVGVARRSARPGEHAPAERRLMPVQPASSPEAARPAAPEPAPTPPSAPAPTPPSAPAPTVPTPRPDATGSRIASGEPRFADAKVVEVVPLAWEGHRISLRQGSATRTTPTTPGWLDLDQVQAVASAGVAGLAARPVVLIDLLLNWRDVGEGPLRVLRLRSDRFDPSRLLPGSIGGLDGFRAVLAALLDQSGAHPLPDARQARGHPFARFDRLDRYEREVLGVDR